MSTTYILRDTNGNIFNMEFAEATYNPSTNTTTVHDSVKTLGELCKSVEIATGLKVGGYTNIYPSKTPTAGTDNYFRIKYEQFSEGYNMRPWDSSIYYYGFLKSDGTSLNSGVEEGWAYVQTGFYDPPDKAAGQGAYEQQLLIINGYGNEPIIGITKGKYQTPPYTLKGNAGIDNPNYTGYVKVSDFFGNYPPKTQFPGDTSDTGGGDGEYDISDTPILLPILPQYSATDTKFVSIYLPTEAQIKSLASYVWGTKDFWTAVYKDMVANPMDLILGLGVIPNVGTVTGEKSVKVGIFDTGVAMNYTEKQFFDFDCGKVTIGKYYGNAIDQSPNTRFSIFLPFIGVRQLNTDEIIGREVGVHYRIDVVSGQCLALIQIDGSVRYQFAGSCLSQIPFSGSSYNGLINAGVNMAIQTGTAIATGGATGAVAVASGANFLSSMKPDIHRVGGIGGSAGVLGVLTPYIIRETPKQSLANDYNKFVGYPSNITAKLSELTGFTQIEKIRISGIIATDVEITEIEQLLKQGVIL